MQRRSAPLPLSNRGVRMSTTVDCDLQATPPLHARCFRDAHSSGPPAAFLSGSPRPLNAKTRHADNGRLASQQNTVSCARRTLSRRVERKEPPIMNKRRLFVQQPDWRHQGRWRRLTETRSAEGAPSFQEGERARRQACAAAAWGGRPQHNYTHFPKKTRTLSAARRGPLSECWQSRLKNANAAAPLAAAGLFGGLQAQDADAAST